MRTPKFFLAATAAALTLMSSGALRADDTEIFVSEPKDTAAARPNILLIIDTSGSMVSNNVTQPMDYDPITKYTGGSCTADKIYWKTGNGSVSCSSGSSTKNQYIDAAAMACKTAKDVIDSLGTYVSASTAQWRAGSNVRWEALRDDQHTTTNPVECLADAAIKHGLADNDGKLRATARKARSRPMQRKLFLSLARTPIRSTAATT